ncbi:TIGR02444 family protein [Pseudomonas sp. AN-1]|uniref:TIGR02444 family protein n=1 Tax=Pseudomonas sp. AN-1 TaxID=3096605 RepID=UPI002A6B7C76|nr:TIGR02444 family protein [Pseudomonas sp. AN-1]WPP44735.1 TIGR02444 family protein [Pseudomonas sp. AN-1]
MQQSLWDFSVALYARPGVAELCLRLQDERDADVCLLLAALWLERRRVDVAAERVAALRDQAGPWQRTVTLPLRRLRRAWKAPAADDPTLAELRRQLAELELQAERLLLERLQALAEDWPATPSAEPGAWLAALAPECRDALAALRVAAGAPQS